MTRIKLKYVHAYRDRWGRVRRYFRRRGYPKVALPGLPGSPEFTDAYRNAIAGAPVAKGHDYKKGTLGDLVTRFYGAAEFANLAASSKRLYRLVLSQQVERHGHRMGFDLPMDKARKIIEEIGGSRPGMANLHRKVLAALFTYAIDIGLRKDNPFARVPKYKLGERHTWTEDEIAQYERLWPLGTRERLAFAVLLYSAQRVSDAVRLKRSDTLTIKQQKTGVELTIPVHPALARALKAGQSNSVYMICDSHGRPIPSARLTKLISQAALAAGLPKECTAHGLRKAAMRRLAEQGASSKEMAAVSGHRTLREIERYTARADQGRLSASAIARLPDENENKGG
jgi:integrase